MAGVGIRQCFAFTRKAMAEALADLKQNQAVKGCILLSTCNRTELWVNLGDKEGLDLPGLLCRWKQLDEDRFRSYLQVREGTEAVRHLFYLSAGLKSQIMGEDQILSQVKEALAFAREQESTDRLLEVLFRMAVTAGKQVKTEVSMDKANFSAAHQAIHFLKEKGMELQGKKALVIGNGEMGKITAQALMEEGAEVTVTVRQYRSGMVNIPKGAKRMDYGERYRVLPDCDVIFSATASPNLTITRAGLKDCPLKKKQVYVDLAVPRDIEESIRELGQIQYYDMDAFHMDEKSERMKEQYHQAELILQEHIQKFLDRQENRNLVPRIQKIGAAAGEELCWRMEKELKSLKLTQQEREILEKQMELTTEKVVNKLMFALRDELDSDTARQCMKILETVYS